jgi:hypothetical protein
MRSMVGRSVNGQRSRSTIAGSLGAQAAMAKRGVGRRAAGSSLREIRAIFTLSGGERAVHGRAETAAMPSMVRADDRPNPAAGLSSIRFLKIDTRNHSPYRTSENVIAIRRSLKSWGFPATTKASKAEKCPILMTFTLIANAGRKSLGFWAYQSIGDRVSGI